MYLILKDFHSNRAREERALAAEKRLSTLSQANGKHMR
jgi:hypothetical protein